MSINKDSEQQYKSIVEEIRSVVIEQLAFKGEITEESNFASDLGADSLDTVELVMAIEEQFEIDIPDEKAESITTVREAAEFIQTTLNNKKKI